MSQGHDDPSAFFWRPKAASFAVLADASASSTSSSSSNDPSFPTGTIAALALAGILIFIVLSSTLYYVLIHRPRKRRRQFHPSLYDPRRKSSFPEPKVSDTIPREGQYHQSDALFRDSSSRKRGFDKWRHEVESGLGISLSNLGISFRHSTDERRQNNGNGHQIPTTSPSDDGYYPDGPNAPFSSSKSDSSSSFPSLSPSAKARRATAKGKAKAVPRSATPMSVRSWLRSSKSTSTMNNSFTLDLPRRPASRHSVASDESATVESPQFAPIYLGRPISSSNPAPSAAALAAAGVTGAAREFPPLPSPPPLPPMSTPMSVSRYSHPYSSGESTILRSNHPHPLIIPNVNLQSPTEPSTTAGDMSIIARHGHSNETSGRWLLHRGTEEDSPDAYHPAGALTAHYHQQDRQGSNGNGNGGYYTNDTGSIGDADYRGDLNALKTAQIALRSLSPRTSEVRRSHESSRGSHEIYRPSLSTEPAASSKAAPPPVSQVQRKKPPPRLELVFPTTRERPAVDERKVPVDIDADAEASRPPAPAPTNVITSGEPIPGSAENPRAKRGSGLSVRFQEDVTTMGGENKGKRRSTDPESASHSPPKTLPTLPPPSHYLSSHRAASAPTAPPPAAATLARSAPQSRHLTMSFLDFGSSSEGSTRTRDGSSSSSNMVDPSIYTSNTGEKRVSRWSMGTTASRASQFTSNTTNTGGNALQSRWSTTTFDTGTGYSVATGPHSMNLPMHSIPTSNPLVQSPEQLETTEPITSGSGRARGDSGGSGSGSGATDISSPTNPFPYPVSLPNSPHHPAHILEMQQAEAAQRAAMMHRLRINPYTSTIGHHPHDRGDSNTARRGGGDTLPQDAHEPHSVTDNEDVEHHQRQQSPRPSTDWTVLSPTDSVPMTVSEVHFRHSLSGTDADRYSSSTHLPPHPPLPSAEPSEEGHMQMQQQRFMEQDRGRPESQDSGSSSSAFVIERVLGHAFAATASSPLTRTDSTSPLTPVQRHYRQTSHPMPLIPGGVATAAPSTPAPDRLLPDPPTTSSPTSPPS